MLAKSRRPLTALVTGAAVAMVTLTSSPATAADPPDPTSIQINEVRSSPGDDFVELLNTGDTPIDISGWKAVDAADDHEQIVFATDTTLAPGEYFSFEPDSFNDGFGLGGSDSITIYLPDGDTIVDRYEWTSHRTPSFGRCPAGTGDLVVNASATPGSVNDCAVESDGAQVRINEVESDPNDLVELINTGTLAADLSGYVLKDNKDDHVFVIPDGTSLAAGAVMTVDVDPAFGLGKGDSARLFAPDAQTLIDSTTWPDGTHATSWGRCPAGTGDFQAMSPTLGLPNQCGPAGDPTASIRINEVESNGDKVADWVELTNVGAGSVDISGWKILDDNPDHAATPVIVPAATTVAPGGHYAIYTEVGQSPGFGLGGSDSATLLLPDGITVVDTFEWSGHAATTYGRCPDGLGEFTTTTTSTRGAPNACSPVRINEIESSDPDGPDFVELVNISDGPVDLTGWMLRDSGDNDPYTFAPGSTIPAHGYTVVESGDAGLPFGLGSGDAVRLFAADGTTVVESYSWTSHATQSFGRCADAIGDFVDTKAPTRGTANSCPGLDTEPWPGSPEVGFGDAEDTFVQDLSGLVFDPADPDVLWAAQNKLGTLYRLVRDGDQWVPDTANDWGTGKDPRYTDGTGGPDTEGLTIGPDGFIYAASERNNQASGVSRMSVLRYDPSAAGSTLTATDEWNLTSQIPAAGANLGLEGVTWIPDSFLTANGFVDQSTGQAYDPASYPLHGTGLYVVAVEDTGALHAFALDSSGGTSHLIATISSGFAHLADVTFDPERQRLWAITDDTHDGKSSQLMIDAGEFVVDTAYERPAAMPNLNNEGLAISAQSQCVDGFKEVLWADDGDTAGHSLRTGTIACTPPAVQTDDTAPTVAIEGVTAGELYVGQMPNPVCVAHDEQSGVASCTIGREVRPTSTTLTATATDHAGNSAQATLTYRTLAYTVNGASYAGGVFSMKRGVTYQLEATVPTGGLVIGPIVRGSRSIGFSWLRDGTTNVTVPRSARISRHGAILIRDGWRFHIVVIKVVR